MNDDDLTTYRHEQLERLFGPFLSAEPVGSGRVQRELVGAHHRSVLLEMSRIVDYQWRTNLSDSALKGFLLHGEVGTGKTSLAKRLTYELCRSFGDDGSGSPNRDDIVMIMCDAADIARSKYGETERQLEALFAYAMGRTGRGHSADPHSRRQRRAVVLFDDAECLFVARESSMVKEWHLSLTGMFLHEIDRLDSSCCTVVLTTNRIDMLDPAIVNRFLAYEFDAPPAAVLCDAAMTYAQRQRLTRDEIADVLRDIENGRLTAFREVERRVTRSFVAKVVNSDLASEGDTPWDRTTTAPDSSLE